MAIRYITAKGRHTHEIKTPPGVDIPAKPAPEKRSTTWVKEVLDAGPVLPSVQAPAPAPVVQLLPAPPLPPAQVNVDLQPLVEELRKLEAKLELLAFMANSLAIISTNIARIQEQYHRRPWWKSLLGIR